MRSLSILLSFSLILLIPIQSQAYGYVASTKKSAYLEAGIGATLFEHVEKDLSDYDIPPSPSIKLLLGGRISRSQNIWFEFKYAYNGAYTTKDTTTVNDEQTTFRSQSIGMGLKLTTNPYKQVSTFLKLGGGRLMIEYRKESFTSNTSDIISNDYNSKLTNHGYVGLGANFALGRNTRLGFELQQMQYKLVDYTFSDNTVMMTITRYLK